MERYFNYARSLETPGTKIASATVTVYDSGTLNLSHIFADNQLTPNAKSNPFTTDTNGTYFFYARPGRYDVRVSGGTPAITTYTLGDVAIGLTPSINVMEYGATGDGTTDDTVAIQAALNAATSLGNSSVYIPSGDFIITSTLILSGATGVKLHGGGLESRLLWKGNATGPLLYLKSVGFADVSDLKFQAYSTSFPIANMIIQEQLPLGSGVNASTSNTYDNLLIDGLGVMTQGIYLKGDVTDANNDFNTFNHLFVGGYTEAGVVLQGANCFNNYFFNCQIAGQRTGNYGIKATTGAGGQAGHYCVYGGACLGHLTADFYLQTRCAQPIVLDNVYSEGSERLFKSVTGIGSCVGIIFRGVQWASDSTTAADWIILLGLPGPVLIDSCVFGTEFTKNLRILWSYSSGFFAPSFEVRNTRIWGALNVLTDIFQGTTPTQITNTFAQTGDSTATELFRLRLPNAAYLSGRNAANDADIHAVQVGSDNKVYIGGDSLDSGVVVRSPLAQSIELTCGLNFPDTQIASSDLNTLDDYEEGTWLPRLGSGAVVGQVYSTQAADYQKVGNRVYIAGKMQLSTLGTFSDNVTLTNLPFVSGGYGGIHVVFFQDPGTTSPFTTLSAPVSAGSSSMTFLGIRFGSQVLDTMVQADLVNTSIIQFFGFYQTLT